MTDQSDLDLLRQWADGGSETAFRAVVERYAGLVFGVALRRTGDRPLAEEAVQNVFADLARKAPALAGTRRPLAAWLHRCAVYESVTLLRREIRHREKMRRFAETPPAAESAPDPWPAVGPLLDEAINDLSDADRRVLLLHWFERRTFASIAELTGDTAAAVQRRGSRAIEKLASLLRRRGVVIPMTVLSAGLASQLSQAAPPGLAPAVAAHLISSLPAATGAAGFPTSWFQIMASIKTVTAVFLCAAALPVGIQWAVTAPDGKPPAVDRTAPAPPPAAAAPVRAFDPSLVQQALQRLTANPDDYGSQLELRRLMFSLTPEEIPAVRALLMGVPARKKQHLYEVAHALFARWAELDPAAAADAALALPKSAFGYYPLRGAFVTWAFSDTGAAWTWLEQTGSDPFDREFIGGEALAGIAADPSKFFTVMERVESMSDHAWRNKLKYWVVRASPRAGLEWALALSDEAERGQWVPQALELAGAREPEFALQRMGDIENTARRAEAAHNILWPWLLERDARAHRHPPDMVDVLETQVGSWPPTLFRDCGDALTRHDAATALATVNRLPDGPERREFVQGMLTAASFSDAAALLPALGLLSDEDLIRRGGLSHYTGVLVRQNPQAAAEWLHSLPEDSQVHQFAEPHFTEVTGTTAAAYLTRSPK
ncbi:MAG: hypothetical protein JWM59_2947 [Verrucomicrobiales bacterium]|nr:hypothetical protein [Verrucomicrobiales bacterium]